VGSRVKYHYSVRVVENPILYNPSKASFNAEDAFAATLADLVLENSGVTRHVPTERNVGFVIHFDHVLFNVRIGRLYK